MRTPNRLAGPVKQAVEAFNDLSDQDTAKLKELNTKIQNHEGKWGVLKGGEETARGSIKMPWVENDPLIMELLEFMYDKGLLGIFNWKEWDEGTKLYKSEDQSKYDNIDLETSLKLIYAVYRQDRFADGALASAFESGGFPKLVDRLVKLKA